MKSSRVVQKLIIGSILCVCFHSCRSRSFIPWQKLNDKGAKLANYCVVFKEEHNGQLIQNFEDLRNSGLLTANELEALLDIKDNNGTESSRVWVFSRGVPKVLFYSSYPCEYTHGSTGAYKTENAWGVAQIDGAFEMWDAAMMRKMNLPTEE